MYYNIWGNLPNKKKLGEINFNYVIRKSGMQMIRINIIKKMKLLRE